MSIPRCQVVQVVSIREAAWTLCRDHEVTTPARDARAGSVEPRPGNQVQEALLPPRAQVLGVLVEEFGHRHACRWTPCTRRRALKDGMSGRSSRLPVRPSALSRCRRGDPGR
jgi:hypothetical protein